MWSVTESQSERVEWPQSPPPPWPAAEAACFLPRFFCRVLCPLGALLGVISRFALFRINRDVHKCTDCNMCLNRCEGAASPQGALSMTTASSG